MKLILEIAEKISLVMVWIGGVLLIGSALMVTLEVVLRKIFTISLGGADELSGFAFAIATSLGFSYALFQRAHIRVDVLFNLFPHWLKIIANLTGIILLAGFVGVVCVTAWNLVAHTFAHNAHSITPLRIPLIYPQVPWLLGWLFFVLSAFLITIAAIWALITKDFMQAEKLIGTKTINEQIAEERVE